VATAPKAAFFSYSRDDAEFALRLAGDLKAAGTHVWLDQLDIAPGERWAHAVQDALTVCANMLVVLSPTSVASTNVEDEVSFALEEHKTIIPILYRECTVPYRLRPLQYVDFRTDYARGLKAMLRTLVIEEPERTMATAAGVQESQSPARNAEVGSVPATRLYRKPTAEEAKEESEGTGQERGHAKSSHRPFLQPPRWAKITASVCGALILASFVYWKLSQPHLREQAGGAHIPPTAQANTSDSGGPPPRPGPPQTSTANAPDSTRRPGVSQNRGMNREDPKAATLAAGVEALKANPPIAGPSDTAKDAVAATGAARPGRRRRSAGRKV
jgi:hypothetical protein